MSKFSTSDIKKYIDVSVLFFQKYYPNGASFEEVKNSKEIALKKYLHLYLQNIKYGKDRYNSACNKTRNRLFVLETIEKIMKINNLAFVKNLDFCLIDQEKQINLFLQNVQKESYQSYLLEDDLSK